VSFSHDLSAASGDLDVPFAAPHLTPHLERTHVQLAITPNDDRMLSYQLAVPAGWAYSKEFGPVTDEMLAPKSIGFVAQGVTAGAPLIAVTVTTFPFELTIDGWVRWRLEVDGWKVVSGRWVAGAHSLYYDATAVRRHEGRDEVLRTSARRDGNRVFTVNTRCARRLWPEAKEIFFVAHASFKVLGTVGTTRMEAHKAIEAPAPHFRLEYPFSWTASQVEAHWPGISAVDLRLHGGDGALLAYLQVRAERRTGSHQRPGLKTLEHETVAKLRKAGFQPAGAFAPMSLVDDPRGPSVKGWLGGFVGPCQFSGVDALARFGFVQRGDLTFTLLMTSPPLRDDVLTSLRAARAFEIARDTLQLPDPP
jgi:hypothetical protein